MDRKLSKNQEIRRLIQQSDSARFCLEREAISLKQRLDVPARIRSSLSKNPTGWFLGSIGSGLAASMLFRRKERGTLEKKSRSLSSTLIGLGVSAARPMAKAWLAGQAKRYFTKQRPSH
jgi:hypothetical protein